MERAVSGAGAGAGAGAALGALHAAAAALCDICGDSKIMKDFKFSLKCTIENFKNTYKMDEIQKKGSLLDITCKCNNISKVENVTAEIHNSIESIDKPLRRSSRKQSADTSKLWSDPVVIKAHEKISKINKNKTEKKLKKPRLTKAPRAQESLVDLSNSTIMSSPKDGSKSNIDEKFISVIALENSSSSNKDDKKVSKATNLCESIEMGSQTQVSEEDLIKNATASTSRNKNVAVGLSNSVPQDEKLHAVIETDLMHATSQSERSEKAVEETIKSNGCCHCCLRNTFHGRNDEKLETMNVTVTFEPNTKQTFANLIVTGKNITVKCVTDRGVSVASSIARCVESEVPVHIVSPTYTSLINLQPVTFEPVSENAPPETPQSMEIVQTRSENNLQKSKSAGNFQNVKNTINTDSAKINATSPETASVATASAATVSAGTVATASADTVSAGAVATASADTVSAATVATASADTVSAGTVSGAIAPYKITDSVAKEMSKEMGPGAEVDIFSGSVVEGTHPTQEDCITAPTNVEILQRSGSKIISQRSKRSRKFIDEVTETISKKFKTAEEIIPPNSQLFDVSFRSHSLLAKNTQLQKKRTNSKEQDSDNYFDEITNTVFANIDADLKEQENNKRKRIALNDIIELSDSEVITQPIVSTMNNKSSTQKAKVSIEVIEKSQTESTNLSSRNEAEQTPRSIRQLTDRSIRANFNSENVFTALDKSPQKSGIQEMDEIQPFSGLTTQENVANLLTPRICQDLDDMEMCHVNEEGVNFNTPKTKHVDANEDSDSSIVEETPQKMKKSLITTVKPTSISSDMNYTTKNETICKNIDHTLIAELCKETPPKPSQRAKAIRNSMDSPITMTQFKKQVQYKSTPLRPFSKKSLDFTNQNEENYPKPCQTVESPIVETTLEKEFMEKAFETTPHMTPVRKQMGLKIRRVCVACSCLTVGEVKKVKAFAKHKNWSYLDTYSPELTHLVVAVDESNKSQRSLKYVCALAGSKWIVSFKWIEECIEKHMLCDEAPYEVLDASGESGPFLSRTATRKLFSGMTFYCHPPFTSVDLRIFESILTAQGGRVVQELKEASLLHVKGVALVLVDSQSTEEDYTYTAMEHKVVPVNMEWAINSLGAFILKSVKDLLVCPVRIIPFDKLNWPKELVRDTNFDVSL